MSKIINMRNQQNPIPSWDSTDHLQLLCNDCKYPVLVTEIALFSDNPKIKSKTSKRYSGARMDIDLYEDIKNPPNITLLVINTKCPNCGSSGQRKMYTDKVNSLNYQYSVDFDNDTILSFKEGELVPHLTNFYKSKEYKT